METKQILVVDNEPLVLQTVESQLSRAGHKVLTAESGEEALAIAREQQLDLVISDIDMPPGMDGIALITALYDAGITPDVMLMTADPETHEERVDELSKAINHDVRLVDKPFGIIDAVKDLVGSAAA